MPTNIYTEIEVDGKKYSIKKFDAKTGLKIARMVIAKAAPLIPLLERGGDGDNGVYESVGAVLDTLSDRDIDDLVDKCLRVCYVSFPAGLQPIIDETGHYGVEEVEYDLALTIRLCFEAIKWGASDFFGGSGSGLKQIMSRAGLSQNP